MMVDLPALVGTAFGTVARELSPKGVQEMIQKGFAIVEKWGLNGAASEKGQASRLIAKELVERRWIQRASVERKTLEWGYSDVGEEIA